MSIKRSAESDLNHENWADEEEPQYAGNFKPASEETMRERRVIKAKRRTAGGTSSSESLFASFKGFSNTPTIQPSPGTFDFSKTLNKTAPETNIKATSSTTPTGNPFANINLLANKSQATNPASVNSATLFKETPVTKTEETTTKQSKRIRCEESESKASTSSSEDPSRKNISAFQKIFEDKVKELNFKFIHFIHTKVKANPYVILFPPMDDYKKYIEKFMKEKLEAENNDKVKKEGFKFDIPPQGATGSVTIQNNTSSEKKTFTIGDKGLTNNESTTTNGTPKANPSFTFSATASKGTNGPKLGGFFGSQSEKIVNFSSPEKSDSTSSLPGKSDSSSFSSGSNFALGSKSNATPYFSINWEADTGAPKPFPFFSSNSTTQSSNTITSSSTAAPVKPFSFGFANAPPPAPKPEENDDEPLPKEEIKEIVEEDSIFNIKAKIFVMKSDKTYGERGVGNLFVKPVEENVKAQVIVRTETDTGKIIFNIVVSKNVPIKREKNNLMLMTVPHPTTEKNPTPVACLIRVKTAEDAEKLLTCLEKFKN